MSTLGMAVIESESHDCVTNALKEFDFVTIIRRGCDHAGAEVIIDWATV
jgi:hypothetical protein